MQYHYLNKQKVSFHMQMLFYVTIVKNLNQQLSDH